MNSNYPHKFLHNVLFIYMIILTKNGAMNIHFIICITKYFFALQNHKPLFPAKVRTQRTQEERKERKNARRTQSTQRTQEAKLRTTFFGTKHTIGAVKLRNMFDVDNSTIKVFAHSIIG